MNGFTTHKATVTNILHPTLFAIEQTIRAIKHEIANDPPFHRDNDTRRAEIDQLTDMLDRRR